MDSLMTTPQPEDVAEDCMSVRTLYALVIPVLRIPVASPVHSGVWGVLKSWALAAS